MKNFSGVSTALITPFYNGQLDVASLEKLIQFQVENGVDGFVLSGTTGESPTITASEKEKLYQVAKAHVPKNFPLIFGTGWNSTQKTIDESRWAEKLGADAILVVVPYYNKPPQRGLFQHFMAIADSVEIPTILYNVPSRTITSLELDTIKKLSEHPKIIGIKEASGNTQFAHQIRQSCGSEFLLLSGDDGTYSEFLNQGGDGVISVASHIIPEAMKKNQIAQHKDLIDLLFTEANPIPVKMALYLMGVIKSPELRLPLVTLNETGTEKLKLEMQRKNLL